MWYLAGSGRRLLVRFHKSKDLFMSSYRCFFMPGGRRGSFSSMMYPVPMLIWAPKMITNELLLTERHFHWLPWVELNSGMILRKLSLSQWITQKMSSNQLTTNGILLIGILSWTTNLVTPRAVSVVIWTGPRWRVGKPWTLSSEVLSRGGSSP